MVCTAQRITESQGSVKSLAEVRVNNYDCSPFILPGHHRELSDWPSMIPPGGSMLTIPKELLFFYMLHLLSPFQDWSEADCPLIFLGPPSCPF